MMTHSLAIFLAALLSDCTTPSVQQQLQDIVNLVQVERNAAEGPCLRSQP